MSDSDFLQNVISLMKLEFFSMIQPMHWTSPRFFRKAKVRLSKSKSKAITGELIYIEWVPEGQTVDQIHYKHNFRTPCGRMNPRILDK